MLRQVVSLSLSPSLALRAVRFLRRWIYAYETGVALICLCVTIGGAKAFAKASLVIFVVVMISVVTYVPAGFNYSTPLSTAAERPREAVSFWSRLPS